MRLWNSIDNMSALCQDVCVLLFSPFFFLFLFLVVWRWLPLLLCGHCILLDRYCLSHIIWSSIIHVSWDVGCKCLQKRLVVCSKAFWNVSVVHLLITSYLFNIFSLFLLSDCTRCVQNVEFWCCLRRLALVEQVRSLFGFVVFLANCVSAVQYVARLKHNTALLCTSPSVHFDLALT